MKHIKNTYLAYSFILLTFLGGCSQHSSNRGAVMFHNLTAKYNAYVIAQEKMVEVEKTLQDKHKYDYNQLMPIVLPLDSTEAKSMATLLDDIIKKSSLIPNRHQNSKWVDNALILLGKARLYKGQMTDGIETLRYLNGKATNDNDQHEGLIWLMRAYIETNDFSNALAVAEFLRSQPLNDNNTRDFYLTKAYLHQKNGEYNVSVAILEETFDLMNKGENKARVHFAAGQMYDLLQKMSKANEHYAAVAANRPSYDLDFYARMNTIQNEALTNASVSTETGFKQLLNDRKTSDLRDRIYYTMGLIESRKNNFPKAIGFFRESIKNTTTNTSQVPYTYLEMARIHYDKLQDYEKAQAYYDSSLALLPPASPDFKKVSERKIVLDDFVKQLTVIRTEDSLQRLSQMAPNTLDKFLDALIQKEIDEEKKRAAEAQRLIDLAKVQSFNATFDDNNNERFVLYYASAVTQGKIEFKQRWGSRILEDNWRRSNKTSSILMPDQPNTVATSTDLGLAADPQPVALTSNEMTPTSPAWTSKKNAMKANIPMNETAVNESNKRLENAYYKLGKIYKLNLDEPANATKTFETLLERSPNSQYKAEVYYLLFLSSDNQTTKASWKEKLLAEFPNSSFARLVNTNGTVTTVSAGDLEASALKEYTKLLGFYESANYTEALAQLENAQATYAQSRIADKFAVLKVFLAGKINGKDAYLTALNDFVKNYPNSSLLPRVKEILEATAK